MFLGVSETFGIGVNDLFYPSGECRLVVNLVLVKFKIGVGVHIGIEVISELLFWDVRLIQKGVNFEPRGRSASH